MKILNKVSTIQCPYLDNQVLILTSIKLTAFHKRSLQNI